MKQLIWLSMPGAFIVIALVFVWPAIVETTGKSVLSIVLIPMIGFFVHQTFRLIFELSDGFKRQSRIVLDHIIKNFDQKMDREKAFLIWEVTFYGKDFPQAFRDHNRGMWHYIFSFWSTSIASFIGFLIIVYGIFFEPIKISLVAVLLVIEYIAAATFYFKGKSTQDSLYKQEVAIFYMHKDDLFWRTYEKIKDM